MKAGFTLISILLFLLMLLTSATAVSFTATPSPFGVNAGQSNQLVNFSIQNTGSVNITKLNITIPSGFTLTGTYGTSATSLYTASSTTVSWTNSSSIGIVGNGATQYFWIYVNTPATTASYGFNITTLDANDAFSSNNVTFSIFDILAPTYSSNTSSPTSNTSYVSDQSYWFNVSWSDNVDVSKALIENNFTGTLQNQTMSNSSSVYYFNTRDLSAGTYVWRVYANDTNNTFNSTPQVVYLVGQATNTLRVYLNGTLNNNITSILNTAVNVTVNASCTQATCTITIGRDGTNIGSSTSNPYSITDTISSTGSHYYTISAAGNANYTSNSATYYVGTVTSYSTSTSNIPLTYSNSTTGAINITFTSNPNLANALIQGDWTGTVTNFTMSNSSTTNYYYNTTFPGGTSTWKIYGNYSNHIFNLTVPTSFTINKDAPNITLIVSPEWTLDSSVQTNVSCTVATGFTATLYRNGTATTNPDVQTFSAASIYEYLCNNTVNQNYTTHNVKRTLIIKAKPSVNLTFTQVPTLVEMIQNSSTTSEIKVKNTGGVQQSITLELSGIDKSWYSINQATTNVLSGATATFVITFSVGNVDIKDYSSKFTVTGTNGTLSQGFTLRILPSNETKLKINDTIALYKLDASKLENKLAEIKTKINNTGTVEQKLEELKAAIKQAEDYVNSNNYFQAQQTFETIKSLISEVENQLKVTGATGVKVSIPSKVWLIILGAIVIVVIVFVAYLFWPVKKGYTPETGYVYGGGKEEKSKNVFKNLLSKFKRKKKIETVLTES